MYAYEGDVSLNPASLDYETTSQYNLTITVSDPDGLTSMKLVTMDIKDVNEAPVIQNLPAIVTIDEDAIGKMPIFAVTTFDQDSNGIVFSMSTFPSSAPFDLSSGGKQVFYITFLT